VRPSPGKPITFIGRLKQGLPAQSQFLAWDGIWNERNNIGFHPSLDGIDSTDAFNPAPSMNRLKLA